MVIKEIFELTVNLAIEKGWDVFGTKDQEGYQIRFQTRFEVEPVLVVFTKKHGLIDYRNTQVLYNHSFNQALWGRNWKSKLKEMVVSPNVYEYLGKELYAVQEPSPKEVSVQPKTSNSKKVG